MGLDPLNHGAGEHVRVVRPRLVRHCSVVGPLLEVKVEEVLHLVSEMILCAIPVPEESVKAAVRRRGLPVVRAKMPFS